MSLTFPALDIGPGTLKLKRGRCYPSSSARITPLPPCGMQGACWVQRLGLISCSALTSSCRRAVLQQPAGNPGARLTWARHTGCGYPTLARAGRRRGSQQPAASEAPNPWLQPTGVAGWHMRMQGPRLSFQWSSWSHHGAQTAASLPPATAQRGSSRKQDTAPV